MKFNISEPSVISTFVKFVQSAKAPLPNEVTLFGIVIFVNAHPEKA